MIPHVTKLTKDTKTSGLVVSHSSTSPPFFSDAAFDASATGKMHFVAFVSSW